MRFSVLIERIRERGVAVGELRGNDPEIRGICEDSRKVKPGDLFIARAGTKTDGTQFIDDALTRGAAAIVLQGDAGLSCAVAYARVADVNLAGALLAHEAAGNPTASMKMIGITGTKGKTTVAYLLRSVLKAAGHKVGMIGTVEIDDGNATAPADMTTPGAVELVELFSRMKANGVTHCVMEVSSHALHQHRVAGIDFAVAIFTNLTGDHLDYHKTMEEYAAAKAMLFEGLKEDAVAIINIDDPWAQRMTQGCKARVVPYCVTDRPRIGPGAIYSIEPASIPGDPTKGPRNIPTYPDVVPSGGFAAYISRMNSYGMAIGIGMDGPALAQKLLGEDLMGQAITTPLVGRHNCYNLTSVYAAATLLGVLRPKNIERRIELMSVWRRSNGAPGRLQRVASDVAFSVFVDYAHTHDALENVLTALRATMGERTREMKHPSRDREGATHVPSPPKGSLPHC